MNQAARYSGIRADRKAGMKWRDIAEKYKCAPSVIVRALREGGQLPKPKATKPKPKKRISKKKMDAYFKVNAALKKASDENKTVALWFVANGKSAGLCPHKSKADAMEACLAAQLKGKKVRLLREVPFRLTVVVDE